MLALAAAALFCIGAQIQFTLPKEDSFALNTVENQFYWSPNQEAIDAATLYKLQNGIDRSIDVCDIANRTPTRYNGEGGALWAQTSPYWPCIAKDGSKEIPLKCDGTGDVKLVWNSGSQDPKDLTALYPGYTIRVVGSTDDFYICAPNKGTIETSHYQCDGGHTMRFRYDYGGYTYEMTISNAVCWYCCEGKDPKSSRSGCEEVNGVIMYKANTQNSLKGRVMEAGQLLCVANSNTTIVVNVVS